MFGLFRVMGGVAFAVALLAYVESLITHSSRGGASAASASSIVCIIAVNSATLFDHFPAPWKSSYLSYVLQYWYIRSLPDAVRACSRIYDLDVPALIRLANHENEALDNPIRQSGIMSP